MHLFSEATSQSSHQTRGNQERRDEMQGIWSSIQEPGTFPRGKWGVMTQDKAVGQTWRTAVHTARRVPGEMGRRHKWHRGRLCCQSLGWIRDRFLKTRQNETHSSQLRKEEVVQVRKCIYSVLQSHNTNSEYLFNVFINCESAREEGPACLVG